MLSPHLQVPSSPTCSSPERSGEQDSLYGDGYSKIYNRYETILYFSLNRKTMLIADAEAWRGVGGTFH